MKGEFMRLIFTVKHNFFSSHPDIQHETNRQHGRDEGTSPVTDKRQIDASDRHQANGHSDILVNLEHKHADNASYKVRPEEILGCQRNVHHAVNEVNKEAQKDTRSDEAEFFSNNWKYEVIVGFWYPHPLRLCPVLIPFAE